MELTGRRMDSMCRGPHSKLKTERKDFSVGKKAVSFGKPDIKKGGRKLTQ